MSLRLRIVAVAAIVVAAVVLLVGLSLHRTTETALVGEVDADLLERADLLSRDANRAAIGDAELDDFEQQRLEQFGARARFRGGRTDPFGTAVGFDALARVLSSSGAIRLVLDDEFEAPRDAALLREASVAPTMSDGSTEAGRARVVTTQIASGAYVQLARPLDEVDTVLQQLRRRTILLGLLAIVGAAAAAWLLAGRTVAPIRALTLATERVAHTGDLDGVDAVGGLPSAGDANDEVGRLATSFRAMVDALGASRRQQRQLVMDASHELRTPLTSLRTNVDVLRRGHELAPESRDALIEDLDAELGSLSELVAELVDLATDVRDDEALAPVTLAELASPVAERATRRTGREILVEERRRAVLEARPEAVGRAIRNLVDNAAKFSPDGTPIRVVIDGGQLVVHDRGPGIEAQDRAAVFERFHRGDATRSLPGSGLGLAIVRQVVEAHDGTAWADESPDGGAAVGFRLPTVDG